MGAALHKFLPWHGPRGGVLCAQCLRPESEHGAVPDLPVWEMTASIYGLEIPAATEEEALSILRARIESIGAYLDEYSLMED